MAEGEIKILTTFFTQKFDFKYEDEKYEENIAFSQIEQSETPAVWLRLTAK